MRQFDLFHLYFSMLQNQSMSLMSKVDVCSTRDRRKFFHALDNVLEFNKDVVWVNSYAKHLQTIFNQSVYSR